MAVFSLVGKNGIMQELKDPELQVGQILWLNGYGQTPHNHQRQAIYRIEETRYGKQYHCVNLETYDLQIHDHPRPESDIFGIGIYYTPDDVVDGDVIAAALPIAYAKRDEENRLAAEKQAEKERRIAIGKARFDALDDKKYLAYLVAEYQIDDSDLMQDYVASHTAKTVILAGSRHTRNLFHEMRKAALNCDIPEIRALSEAPEEYENRENYSGGYGYYLGESKYSGWIISKVRASSTWSMEDLYYAAGFDDSFFAS